MGLMDDFAALAQRVALSGEDVRGCLILSRDGLVLGAFPSGDDSVAKAAWLKFARSLGDPERSFVEFAEQVWVFARRGPYSAFALGGPGVRPGVLLESVEQALLSAEQSRSNRDALKVPEAPSAPTGKPRTSLHPQSDRQAPVAAGPAPAATSAQAPRRAADAPPRAPSRSPSEAPAQASPAAGAPARPGPRRESPPGGDEPAPAAPEPSEKPHPKRPEPRLVGQPKKEEDEGEVDRVLLAQEFSGLLQMPDGDDEGSS
ncbi:MAG: hypothetical protein HY240_08515 [Actinobacteria bacterium]|nr:hypothetical protein [Actinomycetota bacterium]